MAPVLYRRRVVFRQTRRGNIAVWGFASSRGGVGEAADGHESARASGSTCFEWLGVISADDSNVRQGSAMLPNGNGECGRMDAVRQMAKSKGENWGEVERAQLELGKARAAREKRPGRWVPTCDGLHKWPIWTKEQQ
jgi:hypothetical protein